MRRQTAVTCGDSTRENSEFTDCQQLPPKPERQRKEVHTQAEGISCRKAQQMPQA